MPGVLAVSGLRHLPPALLLVGISVLLFRLPLFHGHRFIGNSDRWNHHLSFMTFHADNLARGTFSAWSEHLLMGFDTLATPGNFPSPALILPALFGASDPVQIFGGVALVLLALTLLAAYGALYAVCEDRLAASAGALVYALSTLSLLKLAQNDNEYVPVLLAPVLFHLVRTTDSSNLGRRIALMTGIASISLYGAFLQPLSYVALFLLCYAADLLRSGRRAPLLALSVSLGLGIVLAAPRLLVQIETLAQSTRPGSAVAEYVSPTLLLRFFHGDIFGRSWREAAEGHAINLSEGNLLFASAFASLLLLVVMARGRYTAVVGREERRVVSFGFHVGFILFVFLVVHVKPAYQLFGLLYGNISFLHTRLAVAALVPAAVVSCLALARESGWRLTAGRALTVAGISAAVLAIGAVDLDGLAESVATALGLPSAKFAPIPGSRVAAVLVPEAARLGLLTLAFAALCLSGRPFGILDPGTFRTIVAVIIIGQAVLAADHFLGGPQTRSYVMPFERHDMVVARPTEFRLPSPGERERMHAFLDTDRYRSVIVCPREITAAHCSSALGMTWRLRLADGYLNSVPKRYMTLPWLSEHRGGRSIRLSHVEAEGRAGEGNGLPWKLLSLLNVRNAVLITPRLAMNSGLAVEEITVIRNPSPWIYPRAYFADNPRSVTATEAAEAIARHFAPCTGDVARACDPVLRAKHPADYVEGAVGTGFDASGQIAWRFGGDHATLDFPPSPRRRFLIVNEAYSPRWTASADGRDLLVLPTNVVMRGILVPKGVTRVGLTYRSVVDDTWRYLAMAAPAVGIAALLLRRRFGRLAEWARDRDPSPP